VPPPAVNVAPWSTKAATLPLMSEVALAPSPEASTETATGTARAVAAGDESAVTEIAPVVEETAA